MCDSNCYTECISCKNAPELTKLHPVAMVGGDCPGYTYDIHPIEALLDESIPSVVCISKEQLFLNELDFSKLHKLISIADSMANYLHWINESTGDEGARLKAKEYWAFKEVADAGASEVVPKLSVPESTESEDSEVPPCAEIIDSL